MKLPKWNNEWDQSDPLRGKQGWNGRHYVVVGITALMFVTICGSIVRTAARVYQNNQLEYEKYKMQRGAIETMVNESHRK
jgi:hypothetical protein